MVVHQLLSGAGPVDAVTQQAIAYRALFQSWGWGGRDHAATIVDGVGHAFRPLADLRSDPADLLLIHYSAFAPRLRDALALPNRKLLVSHNVTPAEFFKEVEPEVALRTAVGRSALPDFVAAADVAAGVSAYNVAELEAAGARRTAVIPILFDRTQMPPRTTAPEGPARLLFVGRISPHKRQDELLRVLAMLRRDVDPDATPDARRRAAVAALRRVDRRPRPAARRRRRGHDRVAPAGRRPLGPVRAGDGVRLPVRARGLLRAAAGGVPLRRSRHRQAGRRNPGGRG